MSRSAALALAALAYLFSLLMPILSAQAAGMTAMPMPSSAAMTVMSAPEHCAAAEADQQAGATAAALHCLMACAAAHAPALPSQAPAALIRWSRQAAPLARPHICPSATIIAPDPRPPRRLSAAL